MKLHRFLHQFQTTEVDKKITIQNPELVKQITRVLRLKPGDMLALWNGKESETLVKIMSRERGRLSLQVMEKRIIQNEAPREVRLFCALIRPNLFEIISQKCTECGVSEIIPLLTDRTVRLRIKKTRMEKIIQEAAELAGRGLLPKLGEAVDLEKALEENSRAFNIFFTPKTKSIPLHSLQNRSKINIFIGPEGGWSEEEIRLAEKNNCLKASLGPLTLRTETAAIVATYISAFL